MLGVGWAIGGPVGGGMLVYAITIGPIVHASLQRYRAEGGNDGAGRHTCTS